MVPRRRDVGQGDRLRAAPGLAARRGRPAPGPGAPGAPAPARRGRVPAALPPGPGGPDARVVAPPAPELRGPGHELHECRGPGPDYELHELRGTGHGLHELRGPGCKLQEPCGTDHENELQGSEHSRPEPRALPGCDGKKPAAEGPARERGPQEGVPGRGTWRPVLPGGVMASRQGIGEPPHVVPVAQSGLHHAGGAVCFVHPRQGDLPEAMPVQNCNAAGAVRRRQSAGSR
mmetsp:Transcript_5545/g.15538  ORF Transcript_5545/g.15538 Transcript_5545/m.15538 type:complete len:232 (+) Transcript_5545:216-911(+)